MIRYKTTAIWKKVSLALISLANATVSPGLIKFGRIKLPTMIAKNNEIINAVPTTIAALLCVIFFFDSVIFNHLFLKYIYLLIVIQFGALIRACSLIRI